MKPRNLDDRWACRATNSNVLGASVIVGSGTSALAWMTRSKRRKRRADIPIMGKAESCILRSLFTRPISRVVMTNWMGHGVVRVRREERGGNSMASHPPKAQVCLMQHATPCHSAEWTVMHGCAIMTSKVRHHVSGGGGLVPSGGITNS